MDLELRQVGLKHPTVELVRDVQANKSGVPRRMLVAEGLWENNAVLETGIPVEAFLFCPEMVYSDEARKRAGELAARARHAYRVSGTVLRRVCERPNPDGLVTLARLPDWGPDTADIGPDALVVVADGMEIPGNLGTLLRTCDGVGADCLVMTNRRVRLTHPKVLRASQGMSIRVPSWEFETVGDALDWLDGLRFSVFIMDTDDSVNYRTADYRGRTALVVGSERYGVTKPWYEAGCRRVGIPMLGAADSLNAAVSASVLLYEARAQKAGW